MPLITGNRAVERAYIGATELSAIMHAGVNLLDGTVLPRKGRTMLANLKSSLILDEGTGDPTWSRATKAWGFNELGYLEELASGCAFFGGARLVRNLVAASEDVSTAAWTKSNCTAPTANSVVCSNSTSLQRFFTAAYTAVAGQVIFHRARFSYVDIQFVQIRSSGSHSNGCANFDLINGTSKTIGAASASGVIQVSPGVYDCWVKINIQTSASAALVLISFVSSLDSLFDATFVGDGIKSVGVTRLFSCDVTNYDASYIPEYVSVGVLSAPFHGAGIDGAKYFETDWQGAPIATANLLKVRREASAINNLLQCRNTTQNAWGSLANGGVGSELLTNGAFDSATDWTISGAAYWSVSGGVLNLNAANSSASYYDNSQTYALLVTGKQYIVEFDYVYTSGAAPTITLRGTDGKPLGNSSGRKTVTITCGASVAGYGIRIGTFAAAVGTIDNITIKEAPVQCAQTATGLDGIANTATTLTATAADATILQPTSGIASAARCASAYVKRRTGTGTISFTQDGGSTWTDITSQINSSTWSRVQITATLANPSVGFKISTSGDAIDVDCAQNEPGTEATSPIVTTTATITRNADSLAYQTASNWSDTAGTAYIEAQPLSWVAGGAIGSATNGLLLSAANSGATASDGTNTANGPAGSPSGRKKLALRWGAGAMTVASGGVVGTPGTYDGGMGLASVGIAVNSSAYCGPVAIYNYQMTDAELQAITT